MSNQPFRDSDVGLSKSLSSNKSSSLISSTWSSTRESDSDQTAVFPNDSWEDAPTSKLGLWAENSTISPLFFESIFENPVSFKLELRVERFFSLA